MRLRLRLLVCAFFVSIAAAAIVVSGCGGGGSGTLSAVLSGQVRHDGTREPLADFTVIASGEETETAIDGTWTLDVDNSGGTTVFFLEEGYQPAQVEAPDGDGQLDVGTVYVKPQIIEDFGVVTGIVADAGRRVEGAQVSVGAVTAVTDANGEYTLYNVPEGRQDVVATTGQKFGTADVFVISMRTVTADIAVSTNPPSPF